MTGPDLDLAPLPRYKQGGGGDVERGGENNEFVDVDAAGAGLDPADRAPVEVTADGLDGVGQADMSDGNAWHAHWPALEQARAGMDDTSQDAAAEALAELHIRTNSVDRLLAHFTDPTDPWYPRPAGDFAAVVAGVAGVNRWTARAAMLLHDKTEAGP